MKLIMLLIVSSISFSVFAQKSETPDKIVENEFLKIQKQNGADEKMANENLNRIKNHNDQNINSKNNQLTDVEVITHQIYIGVINEATEFTEETLPVDVMKTIGNVCILHAHKNESVAKSCSSKQLTDLVNAYKVIIDEENEQKSEWRSQFNSFVDVINACHAKENELLDAAKSVGADSEDDERVGEQDNPEASLDNDRYNKDGTIWDPKSKQE